MAITGADVTGAGPVSTASGLSASAGAAPTSGCRIAVGACSGAAAWLTNGLGSGWSEGRRIMVGWRSAVRWPNVGCFGCISHLDAVCPVNLIRRGRFEAVCRFPKLLTNGVSRQMRWSPFWKRAFSLTGSVLPPLSTPSSKACRSWSSAGCRGTRSRRAIRFLRASPQGASGCRRPSPCGPRAV